MLISETRCGIPPSPLLIPSLIFTCLHLISIQNGLTPLEVVGAKQAERSYYCDYQGVIDLLRGYSEEPATLPSHDVSRLTASTILSDVITSTISERCVLMFPAV